jgi:hypothetical protein
MTKLLSTLKPMNSTSPIFYTTKLKPLKRLFILYMNILIAKREIFMNLEIGLKTAQ